MIYRIDLTAVTYSLQTAKQLYKTLLNAFPALTVLKPAPGEIEASSVTLQACYHDETPAGPCIVLEHFDNLPPVPKPSPLPAEAPL